MSKGITGEERGRYWKFPAPSLPQDLPVRLERLEDRSGTSLEEVALAANLPINHARLWRIGRPPKRGGDAGHRALRLRRARRNRRAAIGRIPALVGAGVVSSMGRRQQWVYHIEPEAFPTDFPQRLDAFRRAAGLTWRGLAQLLKVNARTVWRSKAGTAPGSGHLVALFALAAGLGLLHLLLPEARGWEGEDSERAAPKND